MHHTVGGHGVENRESDNGVLVPATGTRVFVQIKAEVESAQPRLQKKDGEKGFDGAVTTLMMQLYLCNSDFRKRRNKKGQEYGWNVAAYCAPEHLWGRDAVTADYKVDPKDSWQKIVDHMHEIYPIATDKQIRKVLK